MFFIPQKALIYLYIFYIIYNFALIMQYAIIAAGEGSRLKSEGIDSPKPLVQVGGERLIDRLLRVFMQNGATDIVVICNGQMTDVAEHLNVLQREGMNGAPLPLRYVVKDTPSSMHSFYELSRALLADGSERQDADGRFILTTVDTIFDEHAFAAYVKAFEASDADGVMAVTDYIEDEKPLYVQTDAEGSIKAFLDKQDAERPCKYISAGIYGLRTNAIRVLEKCMAEGKSRMRNFQRALLVEGLQLKAYPLGRVFDIDHASDVARANEVLACKQTMARREVVGIYRRKQFSPNKVDADRKILDAVLANLDCPHTVLAEEDIEERGLPSATLYVSMARGEAVLDMLTERGATVLNSVDGIIKCSARTWQDEEPVDGFPRWLKRSDGCAQTVADVTLCATAEKYEVLAAEYRQRNIPWVEQPHYDGDLVKFYAVAGTDFFHWSYPAETGQTKFGLESTNPQVHNYPFDVEALKKAASDVAKRIGVTVYGGDAIVQSDGTIRLIDFNDWPSFAPCREEAAAAIAAICNKKLKETN